MTTNFVAKATELIKQAVIHDNNEEYKDAIRYYDDGIAYLKTAVSHERNIIVVNAIKEKMWKYSTRAEDIKMSLGLSPVSPAMTKYIWKLPQFSKLNAELLCNGYVKRQSNKCVPIEIINILIVDYLSDHDIVKKIKNAKNSESFESNYFIIGKDNCQCKMYLDIFPNGCDDDSIGDVDIFLNLLSVHPNIDKIKVTFKIIIKGTDHSFYKPRKRILSLTDSSENGWQNDKFRNEDLQKLNDKEMIIELEIYSMSVIDKYGILYSMESVEDEKCSIIDININSTLQFQLASYKELEWNITNKEIIEKIKNIDINDPSTNIITFASPIFYEYGLKWYLTFSPNGHISDKQGELGIFLHLISSIEPLAEFMMKFTISFEQINEEFTFCNRSTNQYGYGFIADSNLNKLSNVDMLTIKAKISLIDVYKHGKIITHSYYKNISTLTIQPQSMSNVPYKIIKWKISPNIMNKMKMVKTFGDSFKSKIFTLYGMGWYLRFYPLDKEKEKNIGKYINWMSLSIHNLTLLQLKHPKTISIRYHYKIIEMNSNYVSSMVLTNENNSCSKRKNRMSPDPIKFKLLQQFNIEMKIELIDIYDGNKNITNNYKQQNKNQTINIDTDLSISVQDKYLLNNIDIKEALWSISDAISNCTGNDIKLLVKKHIIKTLFFYLKRLEFGEHDLVMASLKAIEMILNVGVDTKQSMDIIHEVEQCDGVILLRLWRLLYSNNKTDYKISTIFEKVECILQRYFKANQWLLMDV